jgi:hypothetical protein
MSDLSARDPRTLTPADVGLQEHPIAETYFTVDYDAPYFTRCWIGDQYDIVARQRGGTMRYGVYRKGIWWLTVHSLWLACAIVADREGMLDE